MANQRLTRMLLDAIYYSGGASLANAHLRGRGSILMLHHVKKPDPPSEFAPNSHLEVTPGFLEEVLARVSPSIFEFVALDEAVKRIKGAAEETGAARRRRPFLCVTLDDGYRDNLENAVPLFRKYSIPYTIFIAPGLVDGRATLWWEDLEHIIAARERIDLDMPEGRREFPLRSAEEKTRAYTYLLDFFANRVGEAEQRRIIRELSWMYGLDPEAHRARSIMTWKELAALAKDPLCTLGAHTIHHYAVARLPASEARFEMAESARLIGLETGKRSAHFAYPYGYPAAAGERDFQLAGDCGFASAVTTRHGVCYGAHAAHLMALPRISLNGHFQKYRYVKTLLSGATARLANRGAKLNIE